MQNAKCKMQNEGEASLPNIIIIASQTRHFALCVLHFALCVLHFALEYYTPFPHFCIYPKCIFFFKKMNIRKNIHSIQERNLKKSVNFLKSLLKTEEICIQNCINSEKVLTLQVRSGKVNLLTAGNVFLSRETQ